MHTTAPEIIADLDSLTETEIEHDGKRFIVRSAPRPAASLALRAAGIALPPTVLGAAVLLIHSTTNPTRSATPSARRELLRLFN